MNVKIIKTKDNSPTLYVPELDEHYHSVNGAMQESMHVFIRSGLHQTTKQNLNILEVGFGTGLNALLTIIENRNFKKDIYYEGIEKYPLLPNIIQKLHFSEADRSIFLNLHEAEWEKTIQIEDKFNLKKIKIDLLDFTSEKKFDLIYFDAFAPDKQPNLWSEEVFKALYEYTNPQGVLVTYSAKGTVKQALRNVGYTVQRLKGPPGKRHIIKAEKI